jgi:hypothetical protein
MEGMWEPKLKKEHVGKQSIRGISATHRVRRLLIRQTRTTAEIKRHLGRLPEVIDHQILSIDRGVP